MEKGEENMAKKELKGPEMIRKDYHSIESMNLDSRTHPNWHARENQMSCQKTVVGKGSLEFF